MELERGQNMIGVLLTLVVLGVLVYMLEQYVPMSPPFKVAIRVIVVLCVVVYLVRLFGLDLPMPNTR